LVSASPNPEQKAYTQQEAKEDDPDLQRAKDLVDLHTNVKVKLEEQGLDAELKSLRKRVDSLVAYINRR
jgi:transposase